MSGDLTLGLACRFYQCFESIQLYGVALVQLVDDLEGGRSVESLFAKKIKEEGKDKLKKFNKLMRYSLEKLP